MIKEANRIIKRVNRNEVRARKKALKHLKKEIDSTLKRSLSIEIILHEEITDIIACYYIERGYEVLLINQKDMYKYIRIEHDARSC